MIVDVSTGHKAGTPSLGTPHSIPHRPRSPTSWTLKSGQNRLSEGQIRAKRLENDPLKEFAILIVALAILIVARHA